MPLKQYDQSGFNLAQGVAGGYENYFLLGDPFPPFTITDEEPEVFVDRTELMQQLHKFITAVYASGDSDSFVILGEYGDGKTHILKYLKQAINAAYANLAKDRAIAVYVRPGGSILDFVSGFVSSLGLAWLNQTADEFFKPSLLKESGTAPFQRPLFGDPIPIAKSKTNTYDQVRESMDSDSLETIGSNDLLMALFAIVNRTHRLTAWSWLRGLPITAQDRKQINVASALKEDNALDVLNGLINFLHRAGYKVVYILFDELEEVSELYKDDVRRYVYLNQLRQFIDDNQRGLALIFGSTRAGWDAVGTSATALERRIISHGRLTSLTLEDTITLVKNYLARAHARYLESNGMQLEVMSQKILEMGANPDLFPYSEAAIAKILGFAHGKVGYVLKGLKMLMKAGYLNSKIYLTEEDVIAIIPNEDVLEAGV